MQMISDRDLTFPLSDGIRLAFAAPSMSVNNNNVMGD